MSKINKTEKNLVRLLVILGVSKKTVNSICCLLTEEGQIKLIEKLIVERNSRKELREDKILEMSLIAAGIKNEKK